MMPIVALKYQTRECYGYSCNHATSGIVQIIKLIYINPNNKANGEFSQPKVEV